MKKGQKAYLYILSAYTLTLAVLVAASAFSDPATGDIAVCIALLMIAAYLAFYLRPCGNKYPKTDDPELLRTIPVRICNRSRNELPSYATTASAGMDIRAFLEEPVVLEAGNQILIPTGLSIELPAGYEAQVRPRSGLAAKNGITVLNSPGTIDADYRGEIKVILVNHSPTPFTIRNGERIAQLVITKHENIEWIPAQSLTETERGQGGFGHTGKN